LNDVDGQAGFRIEAILVVRKPYLDAEIFEAGEGIRVGDDLVEGAEGRIRSRSVVVVVVQLREPWKQIEDRFDIEGIESDLQSAYTARGSAKECTPSGECVQMEGDIWREDEKRDREMLEMNQRFERYFIR
jgi:hypothetical protein